MKMLHQLSTTFKEDRRPADGLWNEFPLQITWIINDPAAARLVAEIRRLTYNGVCGSKAVLVDLIEIFVVTTRLLGQLERV